MTTGPRSVEKWLLALVGVLVALLILSVKGTLDTRRWKGSFRNEMAQRLDLEEQISRFDNERAAWQRREAQLRTDLEEVRRQAQDLKASLEEEQTAKRTLEEQLRSAQATVVSMAAPSNQDVTP
jgi:chromosome segregation ATPase